MAAREWSLFSLYIYIENLKKSSCQKPLDQFQYNLAEMFPWWPFTKIVQAVMICQKTWLVGAGLISPIYIYIENLKNLLVRNHWTDFNITWQKCYLGDPLPRLYKLSWFVKKTWLVVGGAYFPYIIYIENFNDLLVRKHWTDFNLTLQKCFLCNPLSRLFKPSWFIKKPGRQGAGLIFPIYLYYSKFAKDHFFDVRCFVYIITIYNQIATKGKLMFGPHKRVMQLLIWHVHFAREPWEEAYPWKSLNYGDLPSCTCVPETRFCLCYRQILIKFNVRYGRLTS